MSRPCPPPFHHVGSPQHSIPQLLVPLADHLYQPLLQLYFHTLKRTVSWKIKFKHPTFKPLQLFLSATPTRCNYSWAKKISCTLLFPGLSLVPSFSTYVRFHSLEFQPPFSQHPPIPCSIIHRSILLAKLLPGISLSVTLLHNLSAKTPQLFRFLPL